MTSKQQRIADVIKERLVALHYGSQADGYELKQFEVRPPADGSRLAFVWAVTGLKGDEGTLAGAMCRRTVNVAVGPRGGCELLNAKNKAKRSSLWAVWHAVTEY